MDDKNERFQLIIPKGILERIRVLARKERRSVSNMIVVLLVEALGARGEDTGAGDSLPALLRAVRPTNSAGVGL